MKIDVVQLERLGAALSDGLVIGDAEGYVLSANRAACALLGLPPGARPDQVVAVLAGVPRAPVASPSSGPVASLAASLSPEGPHELCLRGADGRVRHLSLSAVALGQPTLVEALVLCELSHLPPIAEPLPLPSEVRRLQQLRDEILSIASHELKNPLTVILGYSAVLAGAAEVRAHPRLSRAADSVRQQSQRMRRLVDQLLDFARLGLGQLTLQRATFSIAEQVRAVAEHYASPDHPLQPTVEGEPLIVAGDTMRLERVLSTLVAGAIRHCPPGAEIAIAVRRVDGVALPRTSYGGPIGAGPYALVSVRDPGLGEEFIDQQVFDSYTPTGGWDTPQADHWLGLYVGAQVLLLHGGVIWTEHRPGDGGTVCYAIPLA